jgi:hypothetical protein
VGASRVRPPIELGCAVRPAARRSAGARPNLAWHGILSEMGMVVVSSTLLVGPVAAALYEAGRPAPGGGGAALERALPRFAADLEWWAEAARRQRGHQVPPY